MSRHCESPHPRGSVPSTAALTIAGLRNASPRVIRTERLLHFSRRAIFSAIVEMRPGQEGSW
jgi:hypothetical protein